MRFEEQDGRYTAPRALLIDAVESDGPGMCASAFALFAPVFVERDIRFWIEDDGLALVRPSGRSERYAGEWQMRRYSYRLL
ncbi:hypothetical protein ACFO5K_17120 [Nocardia halotolerans]|uniref:Uncharacterized protein n=1 Tax=Nocardia halotolerans TaxID=1755878 RepID=A0ABV8VK78_9NOCA